MIIPLYCGHLGTLKTVLSIEVSSIQSLDNTLELRSTLETVGQIILEVTALRSSLLWTLWDLGNCP